MPLRITSPNEPPSSTPSPKATHPGSHHIPLPTNGTTPHPPHIHIAHHLTVRGTHHDALHIPQRHQLIPPLPASPSGPPQPGPPIDKPTYLTYLDHYLP